VNTGTERQSIVMDEVPSFEGDSEAVPLVPSLEGEGKGETVALEPSEAEGEAPAQPAKGEAAANSIGLLLQRVAGSSIDEIDRLTGELEAIRRLLQTEATRIEHQIAEYAHLNESAMQTIKIIADCLSSLGNAPNEPSGEPQPGSEEDDCVAVHQAQAARLGDSRFRGPAQVAIGSFAGV
jgi:hypothetical protein